MIVFSFLTGTPKYGAILLNVLAFVAQLSAMVFWPIAMDPSHVHDISLIRWGIPLSCFLVSLGWWENYVDKDTVPAGLFKPLLRFKRRLNRCRIKISLITHVWKIILLFVFMLIFTHLWGITVRDLFSFGSDDCLFNSIEWIWVWLLNSLAGYICYFCARTAAKTQLQRVSYAVPLLFATPILLLGLGLACDDRMSNPCSLSFILSTHFFWNCMGTDGIKQFFITDSGWICFLWWLSQAWITRHMWFPKAERLAKSST